MNYLKIVIAQLKEWKKPHIGPSIRAFTKQQILKIIENILLEDNRFEDKFWDYISGHSVENVRNFIVRSVPQYSYRDLIDYDRGDLYDIIRDEVSDEQKTRSLLSTERNFYGKEDVLDSLEAYMMIYHIELNELTRYL